MQLSPRRWVERLYERVLERELSGVPEHVAVIQDGNRRYARREGRERTEGHRAGAEITEQMLDWCAELGVRELTLYAFSTENFDRPAAEQAQLFDLIERKLREFATRTEVHDREVQISAIGERERLPARVREAIAFAEAETGDYDGLRLNVALAYGGRAELLGAARSITKAVEAGTLSPDTIGVETISDQLADGPQRDVDLIIRTGGDERTSNFLPWHANGNEAAVVFCSPFWPEFRRLDLLRAIRTFQSRQASWRRSRAERAYALIRTLGEVELTEARRVLDRFRGSIPGERATEETEERTQPAD
jgi:tritrans,polycis-undecaprenyl-diphosphate synthase [geranylgeranyl-diphosphate specific]